MPSRPAHPRHHPGPPGLGTSRRRWWSIVLLAAVVLPAAITGCTSSSGDAAGAPCVGPVEEPLDPQSALHLLPNAYEPPYLSDPPSSGPHVMDPPVQGAVDDPLSRPVQVGVLERGDVLVQYPPGDPAAGRVRALAGPHVVVAPNPEVSAVVATAWRVRLTCPELDRGAVRDFIDQFADRGPQM